MARVVDYVNGLFLVLLMVYLGPPTVNFIIKKYHDLGITRTSVGMIIFDERGFSLRDKALEIKKYMADDAIKALVFVINHRELSPEVAYTLYSEIRQLQVLYAKPILALIESYAYKGAYLLALAADYIIASPGALIDVSLVVQETIHKELMNRRRILATPTPQVYNAESALKDNVIDYVGYMTTLENILADKALIVGDVAWVEDTYEPLVDSVHEAVRKLLKDAVK